MYYGYEAGLLRIAEMRQRAAAERRAREAQERRHDQDGEHGRSGRPAGRHWFRAA